PGDLHRLSELVPKHCAFAQVIDLSAASETTAHAPARDLHLQRIDAGHLLDLEGRAMGELMPNDDLRAVLAYIDDDVRALHARMRPQGLLIRVTENEIG